MDNCIFCKILNKEIPSTLIFEDETISIIMDAFPESKGHCLIITKQHYKDLFEVPKETLNHIIQTSQKLAKAVKKSLNTDGIKMAQFNGKSAGQTVFHYHMHIIPAYSGVSFKRHIGDAVDSTDLNAIANLIKNEFIN